MDELTIVKLLNDEIAPALLREELIEIGRRTAWEPFLEIHHVEPERVEEIHLTQLQHLAIHICIAKLNPTRSNYAKVCAFVRNYPGAKYHRIISLSDPTLQKKLISFGQKGGDTVGMNNHPNSIHRRHNPTEKQRAQRAKFGDIGKQTAEKLKGKPRSVPITWNDKISLSAKSEPVFTCEHCGKQVRRRANLIQHQRSSKCKK